MTKTENKQRIKNEAINAISRLYHPKSTWKSDPWDEASVSEQKGHEVEDIMWKMFKELDKLEESQ